MAAQRSDMSNLTVRVAPAFGLTDLGFMPATVSKAVSALPEPEEKTIVDVFQPSPEENVNGDAPLRILMVDDDALILMNSVDMLEDLGFDVTSASSGAKALVILEADTMYDLLITDYSMPTMSGLQLAKAVRMILPKLPILLATGYTELPEKSDMALPQLLKPYQQFDLKKAIEMVML